MQKEEIFALIDQLAIDQSKFNRFYDHVQTFCSVPRCKKGCLEFINEVFNVAQLDGRDELALVLVTDKTHRNSYKTRFFIEKHPITEGYLNALVQARALIMNKISEYVLETSKRLSETNLSDKEERQVYLRRAVARLKAIFFSSQKTVIDETQWPEVQPYEYTDYLLTDLETLVKEIDGSILKTHSSIWGDYYGLDQPPILNSLRGYVNYLDTFLKF